MMYNLKLPPQLARPLPKASARFPLTLVIPPDKASLPGLALPGGQWRRLASGAIEVVFNSREELQVCLDATRALRGG